MGCLPYFQACEMGLNAWGHRMMQWIAEMEVKDRAKRSRAAKLGWRRRRRAAR